MAPGARSKFGALMFEPEVFRKQMHCIEESTCDIVGTFRCPHSESAPGNRSPLPTLVRLCMCLPATVMFMTNSMLLLWTLDSVPLPLVIKPKVAKGALQ